MIRWSVGREFHPKQKEMLTPDTEKDSWKKYIIVLKSTHKGFGGSLASKVPSFLIKSSGSLSLSPGSNIELLLCGTGCWGPFLPFCRLDLWSCCTPSSFSWAASMSKSYNFPNSSITFTYFAGSIPNQINIVKSEVRIPCVKLIN